MGCNTCKSKNELVQKTLKFENDNNEKKSLFKKIAGYFLKVILFLISSILLIPVSIGITIWILFNTLILNKKLDVFSIVYAIGKLIFHKKYEEEKEDDEDFDEENYELEDISEVVVLK